MANPYFNATYYLQNNLDLVAAGINTVEGAWAHYVQFGAAESITSAGRKPAPWFDINYYLTSNPDLLTAQLNPGLLFEHFVNFGMSEGRQPSAEANVNSESLAAYAAANADLRAAFNIEEGAELTKEQELQLAQHFYAYGYNEAREGKPSVPVTNEGQTFMLTKGLDNVPGTSGNDTIIGSIDNGNAELNTLSAQDIINGGAGTDTLKIAHNDNGTTAAAVTLGNLSNVEIVEVESAASQGMTVNTTTVTGVTNLNVTKAAGAVVATAGATTDVDVSLKDAAGIATVTVNGGKDVNVALTDAVSNIDVGATGTDPVGAVTITATSAAVANNANPTMGTISVGGGKTVNVTQKAGDASAIVADGTTEAVTQGNVVVTANATTTDVTVKQDAAVTAQSRAAVTGVTEVASVKFTKLDAGESVTISGLTFTAAAGKNLTADQVAAAFANLSASAIKPTNVTPTTATGDTNGGSASANGTFTGALLADWTSGAATGDTVVFTGKANTAMATDLATTTPTKATVTTTTQGVTAVTAQNTLGVANGTVTIDGAAALKTVTVDGYANSVGAAGINGATNNALDTINLANGGNFEVDSAAAALGLNLTNVNGTVTVTAGTKTLNAAVSHAKATETTTLVSASAETVNVTGTGNVAGTTATGGLTAATAINTTGMTAGKATFTIADGTKTSYTGGAGVDSVTVSNANVAITKAIDLGAGDDTLTLNGVVVAPTATLKGGDGTDTIAMNGESAAALSANATFAGKIEGFEKLSITDKVTVARTVNMANMDGITYVVSNNASASATVVGSPQKYVFDIAGLQLDDTETLSAGGVVLYTAGADDQAAGAIATAIGGTSTTINGVVYNITVSGTEVTLTSAANVAPQPAISVTATNGAGGTPITNAGVTTTAGVADVAGGTSFLTIDKMANNGTLELVGAGDGVVVKMADATGSADSFNIVTKVSTVAVGNLGFGTVDVAGVETLKLNAVDTEPTVTTAGVTTPSIQTATLNLKADKATSLTIEGNSNVTLTLDADTKVLATIDASALTGNLSVANSVAAVAMTITGGSGNDYLTASVGGAAKADVLIGGLGNDTLFAGSNGATLTGGEGNDLFVLKSIGAGFGTTNANSYSTITDFKAGDALQLQAYVAGATADVTGFGKLAAALNENTAQFTDFVNAAIKEAAQGAAVWFNYKGDAYVAVDSGTDTDAFINGEDLIIKLAGVSGDNLSWNSDFATVALI